MPVRGQPMAQAMPMGGQPQQAYTPAMSMGSQPQQAIHRHLQSGSAASGSRRAAQLRTAGVWDPCADSGR